jgi:hypothetical protein
MMASGWSAAGPNQMVKPVAPYGRLTDQHPDRLKDERHAEPTDGYLENLGIDMDVTTRQVTERVVCMVSPSMVTAS